MVVVAIVCVVAATGSCERPCQPQGESCQGNTRQVCFVGAEPSRDDCGARTCTVDYRTSGAVYAACALGARDPRCEVDEDSVFCDGDALVVCRGRYPERRVECAANGGACRTSMQAGTRVSACVLSASPDPACSGGATTTCDGSFYVRCFGTFAREKIDCASTGRSCHVIQVDGGGTSARCE